jgi:hypothetical protein
MYKLEKVSIHKPANVETASAMRINVVLQGFLGDVDSLREVFDLVVPPLRESG